MGAIATPLVAMTIYLLLLWPRPHGTSAFAQLSPYLACLALGLPFALMLPRDRRRRGSAAVVYLTAGFAVLWIYALMMLCRFRGSCL